MNTADLTTVDFDGTGVFDVLAKAVGMHLEREFNESRITSTDYANAYIQLLSAAMSASVQYAISKPTEEAKVLEMEGTRDNNIARSDFEKLLVFWKAQNEKAQSFEVVQEYPYDETSYVNVSGVIGKQKTLYQRQAEGYEKDAIVKATKVFTDVAMLQLNINENYNTASNGLNDVNIDAAVNKMKQSVGI